MRLKLDFGGPYQVGIFPGPQLFMVSLAFLIAVLGSRWVSQINVGGIFLLDWLVSLGLAFILLTYFPRVKLSVSDLPLVVSLLLIPGWSLFRFPWIEFDENALRDIHPFAMAVYGIGVGLVASRASAHDLKRVFHLALFALAGHYVWLVFVKIAYLFDWPTPSWIEIRGDLDGTLVAVLGVALLGAQANRGLLSPKVQRILGLFILAQVGWLGSRSSVIAAVVLIAIWFVYTLRLESEQARLGLRHVARSALIAAASLLLTLGPAIYLDEGQKYQNAFRVAANIQELSTIWAGGEEEAQFVSEDSKLVPGQSLDETSPGETLAGTAAARVRAWMTVLAYLSESSSRPWLGTGPGSEYLRESGGTAALLGSAAALEENATRHPHNGLLHVAALLGFPAALYLLLLFSTAILLPLMRPLRYGRRGGLLPVLVLAGYLVASMFGVIFEGPYGSVPIFWATGITLGIFLSSSLTVAGRGIYPRLSTEGEGPVNGQ